MNKKKVFLTVFALILVCCLSVTGTLAYLSFQQSGENAVVNTFVAAGNGNIITDDENSFKLVENKAKYYTQAEATDAGKSDAGYYLETDVVSKNLYDMAIPMTTIPKNPNLTVNLVNGIDAYIFVKITDTTQGNITHQVDSTLWTPVSIVDDEGNSTLGTGVALYLYKGTVTAGTNAVELNGVTILKDNQVEVKNATKSNPFVDTVTDVSGRPETIGMNLGELKFEAYVCQAMGFETAANAFTTCFPNA